MTCISTINNCAYVQTVQISYASEKNKDSGKMDDPVIVAYFYTKEKPWEAFSGDLVSYQYTRLRDNPLSCMHIQVKKSDLVCPMAFVSVETRLYSSPGPTKRKRVSE